MLGSAHRGQVVGEEGKKEGRKRGDSFADGASDCVLSELWARKDTIMG